MASRCSAITAHDRHDVSNLRQLKRLSIPCWWDNKKVNLKKRLESCHSWPPPPPHTHTHTQRTRNAELCCFVWWTPEQIVEQSVELLVIWVIAVITWSNDGRNLRRSQCGRRSSFIVSQIISPNAAYMRQWTGPTLGKKMVCRLSVPSDYLNQCWFIVNWTIRNRFQWNWNKNCNVSIQENAFENVRLWNGDHLVQGKMS